MLIRLQFKPSLVQWRDFSCIQQTNLWKICYGDSLFMEHLDGFLCLVLIVQGFSNEEIKLPRSS
jgi:hypothetical protein